MITTQKELRRQFWLMYPMNKARHYRPSRRQNDYPVDVRMMWVNFVDDMVRDGQITEALAQRATL